jgi:enoyl-CoA hydratase/carnithine racemase
MMAQEPVLYTFTDGVARIRLNRPEVGNAMSGDVARGIARTVDAIAAFAARRAPVFA